MGKRGPKKGVPQKRFRHLTPEQRAERKLQLRREASRRWEKKVREERKAAGLPVSRKDPEKLREYRKAYWRKCKDAGVFWTDHKRYIKPGYHKKVAQKNREAFDAYKATLTCVGCGEDHPECLEFHHLDPKQKKYDISQKASIKTMNALMREINKCIVVCRNCHAKIHHEERKAKKIWGSVNGKPRDSKSLNAGSSPAPHANAAG